MSSDRFSAAIASFDAYHSKDPNLILNGDDTIPKELLYAQRMTARLESFVPQPGEVLKLAARCQHIGRWEIPREKYPMDRKGYLRWRSDEKLHHSRLAGSILRECNYDEETIARVMALILKKELATNPDVQVIEDVACLVFLEHYAEEFASRHPDEKIVDILRKSLKKMSARAKAAATQLPMSSKLRSLLERAIAA